MLNESFVRLIAVASWDCDNCKWDAWREEKEVEFYRDFRNNARKSAQAPIS